MQSGIWSLFFRFPRSVYDARLCDVNFVANLDYDVIFHSFYLRSKPFLSALGF